MSFLDTVRRAKTYLEEQGRVSLGALKLEFDLDDALLEALIDELVDVQQVAAREGKVLSWMGAAPVEASGPEPQTRATPEASSEPAAARQPAEAELRQLTVMFCDLVGSTELAGRLDPEDFRDVVSAYQSACDGPIKRFGGEVAQYLGDGILAYFGYPQAHEDDPERAVRAGLSIQSAIEELNQQRITDGNAEIAARVGIHTGPVVVSELGSEGHRETLALGATSNVAARLEGVAEPGTAVISEVTLRLVQGLFVTRDLGTPALKGVAEALRVYQVVQSSGVRSRLGLTQKLTPLVGRDQELGLLLDRWQLAQEGRGRVILISGEAGLGKSRLLYALRERLADRPHTWLESSCSPYTSGSAFQPVLDVLQQALGFDEAQSPEERVAILERGIASFESIDAAQVVPYLLSLLGLPASERFPLADISPELQREKSIQALLMPLLASAEIQPVVSVNEDLHWADPSTLEFLGHLIDQVATANMLVVLTFRPQFEPPWPTMSSRVTPMVLSRLTRAQTAEMAEAAAGGKLPGALLEKVAARADGVPLFVEELAKSVVDSRVLVAKDDRYELRGRIADLAIPETLQDSLMARLDRLSATKQIAQLAATLGRDFSYELIEAVAETDAATLRTGLRQLVEAEILYQRGAPPEATYTFKHTLLQDTAYQSQLKSTRRALHARIAAVLEERFPERVAAEPEAMARHCAEGGLFQRAITHCQRAGEQALERLADAEAVEYFRQALEHLATLPESLERHQQEIGLRIAMGNPMVAMRGYGDPEVIACWERVAELCGAIGEGPQQLPALIGLVTYRLGCGDSSAGLAVSQSILKIGESANVPFLRILGHVTSGIAALMTRPMQEGFEHLERALEIASTEELPPPASAYDYDLVVLAHAARAIALAGTLRPERALEAANAGLRRAQELDHTFTLALCRSTSAIAFFHLEDAERTQEWADEALLFAQGRGFHNAESIARILRGWARVCRGDADGLADVEEGLECAAALGTDAGLIELYWCAADAFRRADQRDRARDWLDRASALAERLDQTVHECFMLNIDAELRIDAGDREQAELLLLRAVEAARSMGITLEELRARMILARLAAGTDKQAEARARLASVYGGVTEGFDTKLLTDAKTLLEELA